MRCVGGLDLARRVDHSALVIAEVAGGDDHGLRVTHALRLPRGVAYADQIASLQPSFASLDLLAYDASGVGDAVGELLAPAMVAGRLAPVVITGGTGAPTRTVSGGRIAAPKTWLIGNILGLIADRRLVVAPDAPGRGDLLAEMQAFAQVSVGRRGPKMEASRGHDDLVMALALAAVAAALVRPARPSAAPSSEGSQMGNAGSA